MISSGKQHDPEQLLHALLYLREDILATSAPTINRWERYIAPNRYPIQASLENLAHYMALRRHDLRELQDSLRLWGLSSLGRIEGQVLPNLDAVINTLGHLSGYHHLTPDQPSLDDFTHGRKLLDLESEAVLGTAPEHRRVRVMVTMPSHATDDLTLIEDLIAHGMNIARINCAHDTPAQWEQMIANIRQVADRLGKSVKIAMDLAGPKARTADIQPAHSQRVYVGDHLLLHNGELPQHASYTELMQVRCTLPEAITQVQEGVPVWFDDGKIGTIVEQKLDGALILRVTRARQDGDKLKPEKGINFPQTPLTLSALTEEDKTHLDFVVAHADIINYSFVQQVSDIHTLQTEIATHKPDHPIALVLKVETSLSVKNLPELIASALVHQPVGVMIARGDLAVELGFERLAEMQEEILWICEAAHVPVIWATQVLETLAKKGRPSRSEVTDAAMSERAECVMLNKGDYIVRALDILDSILIRMNQHQCKKVSRLRALHSW
ncbi:MAG: pyruvate kinase [Anaerolineae bacterium]